MDTWMLVYGPAELIGMSFRDACMGVAGSPKQAIKMRRKQCKRRDWPIEMIWIYKQQYNGKPELTYL